MNAQQVVVLAFVVGAAILAAALLRQRLSPATASTVVADMAVLAEDAVNWAAAKHVTLDYTPESVKLVEELLAQIHEDYATGELTVDQMHKAEIRYGAYIGETIRRMHGGSWAIDHEVAGPGSLSLRWRDHESFPVAWCSKRIANGEEDNVWFKFCVIVLDDERSAMTSKPDDGSAE